MSKHLKIFFFATIFILFGFYTCFATEPATENLFTQEMSQTETEKEIETGNTIDNTSSLDSTTNNTTQTSSNSSTSSSSSKVTGVSNISTIPEANLGLNNILSILLIAIGVLLILFAIAILIRLKK